MTQRTPIGVREISLVHDELEFSALSLGDGPLVLCLHGFPDNEQSFGFQLQAIADAGYRAVAPRLRGYEPSSQPRDSDYSAEALVGDVLSWIDQLGETTAHVVGHDWGAVIAFVAGALAPERFHSLTTIAVPPSARFAQLGLRKLPVQGLRSSYMLFFQLRGLSEAVVRHNDFSFLRWLIGVWSPNYQLPEAQWNQLRETFSAPGVVQAMLSYYRQNAPPSALLGLRQTAMTRATTVSVPTLAITGADDGCMDTRLWDHLFFEEDFPRGHRIERIANAGHFVHQEKPDVVNPLIVDWLSRNSQET